MPLVFPSALRRVRPSWRAALATTGTFLFASLTFGQAPRAERLVEIGCEDCGDARQLSSTWDVAVTEAGDVLAVDRDAPTLRLFDKAGRIVWARGRPGAGPGEYRFAMRAALGPDGTVQVVDMRARRCGSRATVRRAIADDPVLPGWRGGARTPGRAGVSDGRLQVYGDARAMASDGERPDAAGVRSRRLLPRGDALGLGCRGA
jgi:hypothetical protein